MKPKELKDLTLDELKSKLAETEAELSDLRYRHGTHALDNTARLRIVRRDVARIKTILREYELNIRKAE